ncbi:MAG: hypothetical protein H7301_13495 [Cryobacterium sp.]|nr:hypothetical protein [Oligoflexia bacterium]
MQKPFFRFVFFLSILPIVFGQAAFGDAPVSRPSTPEEMLRSIQLLGGRAGELSDIQPSRIDSCEMEVWPDCLRKITYQIFKHPETPTFIARGEANVKKRMKQNEKARGLPAGTFVFGAPIFFRAFKHADLKKFLPAIRTPDSKARLLHQLDEEEDGGILEVWMRTNSGEYVLFHTYDVKALMGTPMTKRNDGDFLTPEGFYEIDPLHVNPNSAYHLSFDVGYPNEYDLNHNVRDSKTGAGNEIMVHGICASIGCFAMGDPMIEEIYSLTEASLNRNQVVQADGRFKQYRIPMQSFPFRMTKENIGEFDPISMRGMATHFQGGAGSTFDIPTFWENIREGYEKFESTHIPPKVSVSGKGAQSKYQFDVQDEVIVRRPCP